MSHVRPTVPLLDQELDSLSWNDVRRMTLHFDGGMTGAVLDDIEHDKHIASACKTAAMSEWLRRDSAASWHKVVSALRTVSMDPLASKLEEKYCKSRTTPPPSTPSERPLLLSPQCPTAQASTAHSPHQPQPEDQVTSDETASSQVTAPDMASPVATAFLDRVSQGSSVGSSRLGGANFQTIRKMAALLQEHFVTVLTHTKICFMKKPQSFLLEFKVTLKTLPLAKRHHHLTFLKDKKGRIMEAKNTDEILDILEPYWNYVDYALLEYLIKEFGADELQKEMKSYITDLEQFEKKTSVQDFNLAVEDQRVLPAHFRTITVTQDKDPAKCSLYEVRQFKNEVVNGSTLHEYTVYLQGVQCSSVMITLAYPPEAHNYVVLLLVFDELFKKTRGVVIKTIDSAEYSVDQDMSILIQLESERQMRQRSTGKRPLVSAQKSKVKRVKTEKVKVPEPLSSEEEEATPQPWQTTAKGKGKIQQTESLPMIDEPGSSRPLTTEGEGGVPWRSSHKALEIIMLDELSDSESDIYHQQTY